MKSVLLNVICCVFIIISCIVIFGVIESAKNNSVDNSNNYQQNEQFRPDMNKEGYGRGEGEEPPAKPDDDFSGTERPEIPQGENGDFPNNGMPNGVRGEKPSNMEEINELSNTIRLQGIHIVIIVICIFVIILSLMLMIYTRLFSRNIKDVFVNFDKIVIFVLLTIIISIIVSFVFCFCIQKVEMKEDTNFEVDRGQNVNVKEINLDDYDSNITIDKSGEYTLTGSINHTVLVETDGDVVLNLNNVNIKSTETAAIANVGNNKITINLLEDTENVLEDSGSGDYDGALFSNGPMFIDGKGTLYVYGHQEEGEGIATTDNDITVDGGIIIVESNDDGLNAGGDNGGIITINDGELYVKAGGDGIDSNGSIIINGGVVYAVGSATGGDAGMDADNGIEINGGTVIALGSDMLESPKNVTQNYMAMTLNKKISADEIVTVLDKDNNVIISFKAIETFKTIIISTEELSKGSYELYIGGTNTGKLVNNIYLEGKYTKGNLLQEVLIK